MRRDLHFNGGDGEFFYLDWGGSGPLAHFAHATGFCAGLYTPLAERLSGFLRITAMDDRGHGRTRAPADPRALKDWDGFRDDFLGLCDHLGEPLIALGHSRGAVYSLLAALHRPERIRALILIDPTLLPLSWMWWWFLAKKTALARFVPIAFRAARRRREWPDRRTLYEAYGRKEPFRRWKKGFLEAYVAEGTRETGRGTVELCCDPQWEAHCFTACPHDIWGRLRGLKTPTLVLYGGRSDVFLPPAVRRFASTVPSAKLSGFPRISHFVPMEAPDETAEAILSFLREQGLLG